MMRECFGLAKAFRDEQNKKRDDPTDDGSKDPEHPRVAGNTFQDLSKTVNLMFGG